MQIGLITVDGRQIGTVTMTEGDVADPFVPDLEGYEPQGRADRPAPGAATGERPAPSGHHRPEHHAPHKPKERYGGEGDIDPQAEHKGREQKGRPERAPPRGETYESEQRGKPLHREGSAETDQAIVDAARAHGLDVNVMRGIASIESSMDPSSNARNLHKYKGLYQIGPEEWRRFGGGGNIYSARDNAMAAARMFAANRGKFREHFGRDPTDTELYLMHQQGLGFYTRGAMTNIAGNPYKRGQGPQTHESFERGWGDKLARHKAAFVAAEPKKEAETKPFDPGTDPL